MYWWDGLLGRMEKVGCRDRWGTIGIGRVEVRGRDWESERDCWWIESNYRIGIEYGY